MHDIGFLFIYLAASGVSCFTQDLSLLRTDSRCGTWALEGEGPVVAAHGFSSSEACGTLVPYSGIKPVSTRLQVCPSLPLFSICLFAFSF